MTYPPQSTPPEYSGYTGSFPAAPVSMGAPTPPPKSKTPLILGIVGGVLALCLVGGCIGAIGWFTLRGKSSPTSLTASPAPSFGGLDDPSPFPSFDEPSPDPTTEAAKPAPVKVGDCISVDESGDYLGLGNCNGTRGTYRVLTVDAEQNTCSDPESPYITVDGYRLCLELYLVRNYCYKFPKADGWVVGASACKAKGTVHIIDIVPGATNGDRCTKDYKWNHWWRFEHPRVVYCVMQY